MKEKKVLLLGPIGAGKTSVLARMMKQNFEDKHRTTIGINLARVEFGEDDSTIALSVWDIGGEISQNKIPPTHFRNCSDIVYVFDVSNNKSFDNNLVSDFEFLKKEHQNVRLHVVGNKVDLIDNEDLLEANLATLPFSVDLLVSAKSNQNILELLNRLSKD